PLAELDAPSTKRLAEIEAALAENRRTVTKLTNELAALEDGGLRRLFKKPAIAEILAKRQERSVELELIGRLENDRRQLLPKVKAERLQKANELAEECCAEIKERLNKWSLEFIEHLKNDLTALYEALEERRAIGREMDRLKAAKA